MTQQNESVLATLIKPADPASWHGTHSPDLIDIRIMGQYLVTPYAWYKCLGNSNLCLSNDLMAKESLSDIDKERMTCRHPLMLSVMSANSHSLLFAHRSHNDFYHCFQMEMRHVLTNVPVAKWLTEVSLIDHQTGEGNVAGIERLLIFMWLVGCYSSSQHSTSGYDPYLFDVVGGRNELLPHKDFYDRCISNQDLYRGKLYLNDDISFPSYSTIKLMAHDMKKAFDELVRGVTTPPTTTRIITASRTACSGTTPYSQPLFRYYWILSDYWISLHPISLEFQFIGNTGFSL